MLVALAGAGAGGGPAAPSEASHGAAVAKPAAAAPEKEPAKEKAKAKDEAKGETKPADKQDSKDDKKVVETAGEKAPASAPGKEKGAGDKSATHDAHKRDEKPAHEPPPLSITTLREEIRHSPAREGQASASAEREKLEQLAAEINKAREGLRQDTARLEALLEKRAATPPSAAEAPAGGDEGESGKKKPTSLDGLAKAMRGMKPEQAAPIISRLERKMAADVLVRMPANDAGKVMGVCKPEVAAELAAEIASRTPRAQVKR